ncbi:serine-rich adhesin for platelets isoform X1 [Procambarus clarkii]|uniref:serine-rich adhesin for platelets isoform X1 n=1 Tax=Procambarus clarkii TaxID=6728 RepID=UPI001E67679A|nr:endochitinase A-like isoform X1 [Procambarus clarkii]
MAVFLLNHCKFNGCGLSFPNLLELIQHIEETHIETITDPATEAVQETQQPSCLPLSSVLRFFSPSAPRATPRKHPLSNKTSGGPQSKIPKLAHTKSNGSSSGKRTNSKSPPPILTTTNNNGGSLHLSSLLNSSSKTMGSVASSMGSMSGGGSSVGGSSVGTPSSTRESTPVSAISNSPPVSDCEETLHSDNEDSNDSWTTQDEIPAELIIKLASKGHTSSNGEDKPYVCPVVGCRKRYKNVNGIKYHAKNAHKKDSKVRKPYRCYCGKSYCTNQGLKNHCTHTHKNESLTAVTTNTGEVLQVPANQLSSSSTSQLLDNNNKSSTPSITRLFENDGTVQVSGTTAASPINSPIAVTGQIIKGGSAATTKGTTTISSINLTGLVAASGGKIALKALPNGQLLLSQPLEGKLAALVKSDSKHDFSVDDGKNSLVQIKTDGFQSLELSKLLQTNSKLSQHQVAVTTSTLSVAIPASSFNSLKGPQRTGLSSSAMLARALKNQLASTPTGITSVLGSLDNQPENMLGGQGVILGVTMEEGTLVDNGDGTLSELSVIE